MIDSPTDAYTLGMVLLLGLAGGFLSGFLGIGGGIIMAPALLYVLPATGATALGMKAVTGLTITHALFATLSGTIRHGSYNFVSRSLVLYMGVPIAIFALVGAVLSHWVSDNLLGGVFATLALTAAVLMFIPQTRRDAEVSPRNITFSRGAAMLIAAAVGFLGGLVGQGGSFLLIPLMLFVLKVPTRIALGSNLGIVFLASLAGFAGKLTAGQVPFALAAALVVGGVPGAQLGGYLSKRTRPVHLRVILACVIAAAAARIWYDVFTGGF
jgi:uncharacterized membrane protein YfcA